MKTRFIDFEGIHGSGKSACAWNLYNRLSSTVSSEVYFEYDMDSVNENPCDIRMTAVMSKDELEQIIDMYKTEEDLVRAKFKVYNGWYCIFLPDFKEYHELYSKLEQYRADDGRLETKRFVQALQGKIADFVKEALTNDKIYVFKNVVFQQILNELLRTMACDEEQTIAYILEIEAILEPLNPLIFYLWPDNLKEQIKRVAAERISDNYDLYPDWIDWMVEYLQNSRYGRERQVTTREDLMTFFQERTSVEEKCFEKLKVNKYRIMINRMNYDEENEYIYRQVMLSAIMN